MVGVGDEGTKIKHPKTRQKTKITRQTEREQINLKKKIKFDFFLLKCYFISLGLPSHKTGHKIIPMTIIQ